MKKLLYTFLLSSTLSQTLSIHHAFGHDHPASPLNKNFASTQSPSSNIETIQIAVLKTPLRKGQEIKSENINWQNMSQSTKTADGFSENNTLEGAHANQHLKKGAILTRHNVHTRFDVPKGAIVTLIYQSKGLEIRARGASLLHKATVGQRVRVLPPYKKKGKYPLVGKLITPTSVRIDAS